MIGSGPVRTTIGQLGRRSETIACTSFPHVYYQLSALSAPPIPTPQTPLHAYVSPATTGVAIASTIYLLSIQIAMAQSEALSDNFSRYLISTIHTGSCATPLHRDLTRRHTNTKCTFTSSVKELNFLCSNIPRDLHSLLNRRYVIPACAGKPVLSTSKICYSRSCVLHASGEKKSTTPDLCQDYRPCTFFLVHLRFHSRPSSDMPSTGWSTDVSESDPCCRSPIGIQAASAADMIGQTASVSSCLPWFRDFLFQGLLASIAVTFTGLVRSEIHIHIPSLSALQANQEFCPAL